jgi:hypothetical protein
MVLRTAVYEWSYELLEFTIIFAYQYTYYKLVVQTKCLHAKRKDRLTCVNEQNGWLHHLKRSCCSTTKRKRVRKILHDRILWIVFLSLKLEVYLDGWILFLNKELLQRHSVYLCLPLEFHLENSDHHRHLHWVTNNEIKSTNTFLGFLVTITFSDFQRYI